MCKAEMNKSCVGLQQPNHQWPTVRPVGNGGPPGLAVAQMQQGYKAVAPESSSKGERNHRFAQFLDPTQPCAG